jgi:hypothetical protein
VRHTPGLAKAGGLEVAGIDRETLRRELQQLNRRSQTGFWLCAAMLLITFALGIVGVIAYRNQPERLAAVFAASGVTITGTVTGMTKLWEQKSKADMVTTLLGSLGPDALQAALQSLVSTL